MSELFPIEAVTQDSPRLAWMKRVKEELRIYTHFAEGCGWLAMSMAKCIEHLDGYTLKDNESTSGSALIAGWGRLLDEANLIADNQPSEDAAVEWVAMRHGLKLWNEEGGA